MSVAEYLCVSATDFFYLTAHLCLLRKSAKVQFCATIVKACNMIFTII